MNTTGTKPVHFTLAIEGMSCGHCVKAVTEALSAVPGVVVRSVAVGSAQIAAPDAPTVSRALAALLEEGYTAVVAESRPDNASEGVRRAACCSGEARTKSRGGCCG